MNDFRLTRSAAAAVRRATRAASPDNKVLVHAVPWDSERWIENLPKHKAQIRRIEAVSQLVEGSRWRSISRRGVFDLQADPVVGFLAAMAWGFGSGGRQWQVRAALGYAVGRSPRPRIEKRAAHRSIEATHRLVQSSPGRAFEDFCLRGDLHLPYIGPSFGTKYLYFAGFDAVMERGEPPPLILDQLVAASLGGASTRSRSTYERYLAEASRLAGVYRPDVVEHALFEAARA